MENVMELAENFRWETEKKDILFLSKQKSALFFALEDWANVAQWSNQFSSKLYFDTIFFYDFLSMFSVEGSAIIRERQKRVSTDISFILIASSVVEKQILTEDFLPLLEKESIPFHFSCFQNFLFIKF